MNDLWQEGFNIGYKDGHNDGYAKGWHEAIRFVNKLQEDENSAKKDSPLVPPQQILESDS
jgi:hypothetical protein